MKKSKDSCSLDSCQLCRLCLKDWLPAVEAHRKNIHYRKGEVIFSEGQEVQGIYFVHEGSVKIHKHWGEDKELIVRFAKKGDIFGHRGFGADKHYPISATAMEPLTVCYMEQDFFYSTLKTNTNYLFQLMLFYAEELQESEKNMRNLAHMPVKGRLANALLKLEHLFGLTEEGFININISRQDIASYTGTTYETVFRLLTEFTQENLIKTDGKSIALLEKDKLETLTHVS
ncbi:CRP/FNR family transcriptional regulator, anaerobic regulatory protein [Filimonas lacunae]|uniref:CRP/FNR family transcriptional regulator, anaerobic regulatory protein n=1 Tax=Filimonas lacunae TaxID=477680 RepID=A0A173MJD5_9BACT|nr:Crp/Fnr family transcriptional regulator [Filimonas lacunae]BAV07610.1 transcriptional regulator, Crp/Fnr family [Filimonas lacunae]SIT29794.1 CRP/FNR family transcriptional regulator, anaerobic regulatory protein [Filimonas lacunae]